MIVVHSVGPYRGIELYWGIQYDIPTTDSKHVSYAWLVEDLEPFRRSTWGLRVRFGSRALHFGRCVRGDDPHRRLSELTVAEIAKWRGPSNAGVDQVQEAGDSDPGGEQVRPAEPGGSVPDAGVGPRDFNAPDRPVSSYHL